jgi:hypothetical protein
MRLNRPFAFVLSLGLLPLAACGGRDEPPVDAGTDLSTGMDASTGDDASTGRDASTGDDAATGDDASAGDDASTGDDASAPLDMCVPPRCPPIPPGCTTEPSADPCECPIVKCEDAGPGGGVGDACGGRAGPCGPALFCNFTVDFDCGFADGMGRCEMRPDICSSLFAPVCGCDNVTYSNACVAQSMGTDVQFEGECAVVPPPPPPPPPTEDCRTTSCPRGTACMPCPTPGMVIYTCIPSGAAC